MEEADGQQFYAETPEEFVKKMGGKKIINRVSNVARFYRIFIK